MYKFSQQTKPPDIALINEAKLLLRKECVILSLTRAPTRVSPNLFLKSTNMWVGEALACNSPDLLQEYL